MTDAPDFETAASALLAARKQGLDLSPYRVLRVECEHNRRLVAVYRIRGHDIAITRHTTWVNPHEHLATWPRSHAEPRIWPGDGLIPIHDGEEAIFELHPGFADEMPYHLSSDCCVRSTTLGWLRSQGFAAGRVVVLPVYGLDS